MVVLSVGLVSFVRWRKWLKTARRAERLSKRVDLSLVGRIQPLACRFCPREGKKRHTI